MANPMELAQAAVADLVERFQRNLDLYQRSEYREAEVRHERVDALSDRLKRDMLNHAGWPAVVRVTDCCHGPRG
jgi:sirohydrochlorin ferrochelatase